MKSSATKVKSPFWPDGTPKSQNNAFDWRSIPCQINWTSDTGYKISSRATVARANMEAVGKTAHVPKVAKHRPKKSKWDPLRGMIH